MRARCDALAHAVLEHHGAGDRGHALEVVGGAGRDAAEHDLLGGTAGEQHRDLVDQLLAGADVAVLLGQVERVAERVAARRRSSPSGSGWRRRAGARRARGPPRGRRRRASPSRSSRGCVWRPARTRSSAQSKSRRRAASRPARPARMAASLQMFSRSAPARPRCAARPTSRSTSGRERLVARVHLEDLAPAGQVGRPTSTWRSKRPGRSSAGSSTSSRFEAASTITPGRSRSRRARRAAGSASGPARG